LRVLTVEFGESDFFDTGPGCVDGNGGGRDSAGWSDDGDDLGDGDGSARGQDADLQPDGDEGGSGLYDCGDGDSEYDGSESERHVERNADGFGRIQRERGADVYGGSSGDVLDYTGGGNADCGGR
jgi:hypothetical protein